MYTNTNKPLRYVTLQNMNRITSSAQLNFVESLEGKQAHCLVLLHLLRAAIPVAPRQMDGDEAHRK
jgi:hypothetical protein